MYTKIVYFCEHQLWPSILSCLLMLISTPALCDDALLKVYGGGLKLHDGIATTIKMESETVIIKLDAKTYTVDATFEFFNYGKTATVKVGFPKSGYGYAPGFKGVINFTSFETWVNGSKVSVKELPGEIVINGQKADEGLIKKIRKGAIAGWLEETHWLVKDVTFTGNEKILTRVRYTVPYDEANSGDKFAEYLYGTGSSWRGNIGKARFIVKSSPTVSLLWVRFCEGGRYENMRKYDFKRMGEYEFEYTLKGLKPKENENLKILSSSTWQAWDGPDYSVLRVERERLELLSLWQLKVLRYSIYAKHGMIFTEPALDKYFRKYDWYKPRVNFSENDLNKMEQENAAAILDYEKRLRAVLGN